MVTVIIAQVNVLQLVGSQRDYLLLGGAQNVASVAIGVELRDEGSRVVARRETLVVDNALAESNIVSNSLNHILVKGFVEQIYSSFAVRSPRNELANHRVVIHRYFTSLLHTSIDSNIFVRCRLLILGEEANRWQELARRVFGVDTVLNCMSINFHIVLFVLKMVTGGDKNLLLHKIYTCNLLCNRVLHLQAGVHFKEVKVLFDVHKELNCACSVVVARTRQSHSLVAHFLASDGVHRGTRCLLDDFLVSALN